jgi:sec-independent protein translocase protein TatA
MGIENPVHLLFIAVIALVVLGPRRLPELTRAVGRGIREFREAISGEVSPGEEDVIHPETHLADERGPQHPDPVHEAGGVPAGEERAPHDPGSINEAASAPAGDQPAAATATVDSPHSAAPTVDPTQTVRSGDAPDRRPL